MTDSFTVHKKFSGVALVAIDGKIKFVSASGEMDRELQIPFKTNSIFRVASMSKVFTAVLIMRLVQDGKLDLDKTIGDYYPAYKGEGRDKVTIDALLTYSSGIENRLDLLGMVPYQSKLSLDEFIDRYCSGKLVATPGTTSVYGNTEYIILTKIIELVSRKSYKSYLQEIILTPLKLKNTGIASTVSISYTYNDSLQRYQKDVPYYPQNYFGAGALYSTAEDMLKLDQGLFNYKLLSKKYTESMLTIHEDLGYTAYGLWGSSGYGIFKEPFYYRTGGILGANSNWIHSMNSKKTIIVLSNTDATSLYDMSAELYQK